MSRPISSGGRSTALAFADWCQKEGVTIGSTMFVEALHLTIENEKRSVSLLDVLRRHWPHLATSRRNQGRQE